MALLRSGFSSLIPQLITASISLATLRIYTELLLPEQLGEVMLTLSIVAAIQMLVTSATSQSIFYYSSKIGTRWFVSNLLRTAPLMSGVAFLLLGMALAMLFKRINIPNLTVITPLLLVALTPVDLGRASIVSIMEFKQERGWYGTLLILDSASLALFAAFALKVHPSAVGILIAVIASKSLGILAACGLLRQLKCLSEGKEDASVTFADITKYAAPFSLMGAIGWMTAHLDRFVVAAAAGPAAAGSYAVAGALVTRPYSVVTAALTVQWRPVLFERAQRDQRDFNATLRHWGIAALVVGVTGVLCFYIFQAIIASLLLSEEQKGVAESLLIPFAVAGTFTILSHPVENAYLARGQNKRLLVLQSCYIPISISLLFLLAHLYGVVGAVSARIAAEGLRIVFLIGAGRSMGDQ